MPRSKKTHKRHGLMVWIAIIGGTLFAAVLLFVSVSQLKALHEIKTKEATTKSMVAPYYLKADMVRPTYLPTPTSGPQPTPVPVKIPIIMYHYVEYVQDAGDFIRKRLDITPNLFEKHLKSLREANFETYFAKDIPDILDGKVHYNPDKSVVMTFDDGYEDFYTDVFPLLKKYHIRATLYVIYDFVGRRGFVTKQQIQELIDSDLVEIGSHTFDHIYLKYANAATAKKQIIDSKKAFEDTYHIKIYSFAYPYGAMSPQAIADVKEAGYTNATSVIPGVIQSQENLFFLSRIRPGIFGASAAESIERLKK